MLRSGGIVPPIGSWCLLEFYHNTHYRTQKKDTFIYNEGCIKFKFAEGVEFGSVLDYGKYKELLFKIGFIQTVHTRGKISPTRICTFLAIC